MLPTERHARNSGFPLRAEEQRKRRDRAEEADDSGPSIPLLVGGGEERENEEIRREAGKKDIAEEPVTR